VRDRAGAGRRRGGSAPSRPGRRRAPGPRAGRRAAGPLGEASRRSGRPAHRGRAGGHEVHRALRDRAGGRVLDPLEAHEAGEAVLGLVIVQARPRRQARRAAPARTSPSWTRVASALPIPAQAKAGKPRRGTPWDRWAVPRLARTRCRGPCGPPRARERGSGPRSSPPPRRAPPARGATPRCGRAGAAPAVARGLPRQEPRRPMAPPRSRPSGPAARGCPRRACRAPRPRPRGPRSAGGRRPPRVRRRGPRLGRRVEEADREPLGARRLRVVPEGGAAQAAPVEAGHEAQRLGGGDGPGRGMRRLGGRPRLRPRVSQSFRRRPRARASRRSHRGRRSAPRRGAAARPQVRWRGAPLARAPTRAIGRGRASAGSASRRGSS